MSLKKEAAILNLETMTKERISKVLTYLPPVGAGDRSAVQVGTTGQRGRIEGHQLKARGQVGAVHTLGIVARTERRIEARIRHGE